MNPSSHPVKLRVDLAHGAVHAAESGAGESGPEVLVRTRLSLAASGGEQRAWVAWPEVRTLGDASAAWARRPLPDLIEGLIARAEEDGLAPPEVRVPAEVQEHLRRAAPRTWSLLVQRTRLVQRHEAYRFAIESGDLATDHLPAGSGAPRRLNCPLLSLAADVAQGEPFEAEEARLLSELLRARWLHRRLPPGLRWSASERRIEWRHDPQLWVREELDAFGVPRRLELMSPTRNTVQALSVDPGEDLPPAVMRTALDWILGPAGPRGTLFTDAEGRLPRETR